MVHLFDLCLWFGLIDTAWAMAMRGILSDRHLGFSRGVSSSGRPGPCSCGGWNTCPCCSWAFPVEQGIWMEDWDVDLVDAMTAAREAAATPVTRVVLDMCSRDMELPFSGAPKAMARLLDIAILTGNQKAAVNLSEKCHLRPLRRWSMDFTFEDCWKAARTALWAGADFQDFVVADNFLGSCAVPFPQALFLKSKLEDWQEIRHLLPRCHDVWRPRNSDNGLGEVFLESLDRIRAAEDAGLDLQCLFVGARCQGDAGSAFVTLLDMAIWCGQPDWAEACVSGGIELKDDDATLGWHKRVLRGESLSLFLLSNQRLRVVPFEAQTAAIAAGRGWLKRFWKSESSQKCMVLYQMMLKMFKGKSFPMVLVQEILTFSMPVPKIVDQLDLWEHVRDWMTSICWRPFPPATAHVDGKGVKVESA